MLILQDITYVHPNRDVLFNNLNLIVNTQDKVALIGNNGVGKSTLLNLISGTIQPTAGEVKTRGNLYFVPQHFGQYNNVSIAQALGIEKQLNALHEIINGNVTDQNFTVLNEDWTIEDRCKTAFNYWKLESLNLFGRMDQLSGGQKTKVFLAGIQIHQPEIILMDEPSNHLDMNGRDMLYDYIHTSKSTMAIVSHDRTLLNLLDKILELSSQGISVYGGNFDFYVEQKRMESEALNQELKSKEKELKKTKETERETLERQQKLDARGKKKQEKAGLPRISMKTFKNSAEKSSSRVKTIHEQKTGDISKELSDLRKSLPDIDQMKVDFNNATLHNGKILVKAVNINFEFDNGLLWEKELSFQIVSGERIAIKGVNGSGKTTLLKIILGKLQPVKGNITRTEIKTIYIDQDYSVINNYLTVYEQAQQFNSVGLQEHEVKIRLNRFLFSKKYWDKPCGTLSGGEKMRLILCSLTITSTTPDMIVLDEPVNNLDIQNIAILTAAVNEYKGTLIVISHDRQFLEEVNIKREITIE